MGQIAVDLVQIAFSVSVLTARQSLKSFFLHRNKGHRIAYDPLSRGTIIRSIADLLNILKRRFSDSVVSPRPRLPSQSGRIARNTKPTLDHRR